MRVKILLSVVFLSVVIISFITKSAIQENQTQNTSVMQIDTFRISALNNGFARYHYDSIRELGVDLWHIFGGIKNGWTTIEIPGDTLEALKDTYKDNVISKINLNTSGGVKTIMDRCKINYISDARRSDYECEEEGYLSDPAYKFYTYTYHETGINYTDAENVKGIYCQTVPTSPGTGAGWVVHGLKANREQMYTNGNYDPNMTWHILPRIKIDPVYANNLSNYNNPICRIVILNASGDTIKFVNLYVRHFLDGNNYYNGTYFEQFNYKDLDTILTVNQQSQFNPDNVPWTGDGSLVDFRIYWYGLCDAWFDRVRVENQIAFDFFHDNPDTLRYRKYQDWLTWELDEIANTNKDKIQSIYIDEFQFNQLPVLTYLNNEIKNRCPGLTLIPDINYFLFKNHIPNPCYTDFTTEEMKHFLVDKAGFTAYLTSIYSFYGVNTGNNNPPLSKQENKINILSL